MRWLTRTADGLQVPEVTMDIGYTLMGEQRGPRALFGGEFVNYRGKHLTTESAKLYDPPESPVSIGIAAGGQQAAGLAGELGADLIATQPEASLVEAYRGSGGTGQVIGQLPICWG